MYKNKDIGVNKKENESVNKKENEINFITELKIEYSLEKNTKNWF